MGAIDAEERRREHGRTRMCSTRDSTPRAAARPAGTPILRLLWVGVALTCLDSAVSFLPAHMMASGKRPCTAAMSAQRPALMALQLRATVAAGAKPVAKPRGYWHDFTNVEAELRHFAAANGHAATMPATSVLRKNGLSSLVDAIGRFGGVQTVATQLGLECGKPKGYWQDYDNTKKELSDFLALWRKTVGEPEGVPTQQMMRKAGRQDLIAAIQVHGGMQRVADDLNLDYFSKRRAGAGSVSGVTSGRHKLFQARLWSFIAVNGTYGYMPSNQVLHNFDCALMAEEVDGLGGTVRVAKRFGLKPQRKPIGLELIEEALMHFVATSGMPGVIPSKEVLEAAGRDDLEAKIESIGRARICRYLGLYMDEHAKLQAVCNTHEAATSASFVELAVKTQRPDLGKSGRGKQTPRFVRTAPLFKGDTSAGRRPAPATRAQQAAQPSVQSTMRTAASAVNEAVESASSAYSGEPRSFQEMKEQFRKRIVTSKAAPVPASKRHELEALFAAADKAKQGAAAASGC